MRLSAAILVAGCGIVNGFSAFNSLAFHHSLPKKGNSVLYTSTLGINEAPSATGVSLERLNPEEKVQAYVKEPESVEARNNIDGKCLVSGLVNVKDRTDQTLFDLLNNEESAFEFNKLVAFVDDVVFAKKRLFSRSARYSGLMDKLEFLEASSAGGLPAAEQLNGICSWVAVVEASESTDVLETVESIAAVAKEVSDLKNLAILVTNGIGLDVTKSEQVLESLKGSDDLAYTMVVVGKLEEYPEGAEPYRFTEFGTADGVLEEDATYSRGESLRVITELLQLEVGVNKALAFQEVDVNATEAKLIKGLREAGYARMQEIDHMMNNGTMKYQETIDQWKGKNPDWASGYTTDAWWEDEQFQKSVKERAVKDKKEEQRVKDARTQEIENIATEWAKREFFKQSMAGALSGTSEEEYIKSVWDRAMFEGDIVLRQMKGEIVNEADEYADFGTRQERKQQIMLQRAKDDLAKMLDEENLGGDDIRKAFSAAEEADEDKDTVKAI